jgi:8-oxo-dGTP diphosphatase
MPNTGPELPPAAPDTKAGARTRIHVVAGALADRHGRILIARRPEGVHQGGLWEFPGGKLEPGEQPDAALVRELLEELDVEPRVWRPLIRVAHDYEDRQILLDVYLVDAYSGVPVGREGQPLAWVAPQDMDPALFPAADRPIIDALRLPSLYLITGDDPASPERFLGRLQRALRAGIRIVQLRAHGLNDPAYRRLARSAYPLCRAAGAKLLLNRSPRAVDGLPCDGLHLSAAELRRCQQRPRDRAFLVGASCHDAQELQRASELDLDYALLSPVMRTRSHPDAAPLGWERFAELTAAVNLPVYALGGLTRAELETCWRNGGQGIAAIRGLWGMSRAR